MPFIEDPYRKRDEEEDQQPLGVAQGAQGGAAQAARAGAPAADGGTPGRWVNFARYLAANKDAATQTANNLADPVEKAGTGVETELANRQTTFGQDVTKGLGAAAAAPVVAPPSSSPLQPYKTGTSMTGITGTTPNTAPPATPVAQAPANYTGPNALSDNQASWSDFQKRSTDTQARAKMLSDAEGRQSLLNEQRQSPYTAGQSRFDAGLTGAVGGDKFARLTERFSGLDKKLSDADAASAVQSTAGKKQVTDYNAEQARIAQGRKDQLNAGLAKNNPVDPDADLKKKWSSIMNGQVDFGPSTMSDEDYANGQKQLSEDDKTTQWIGSIIREPHGGFLGVGGQTLEEILPQGYWKLPAADLERLTADGGALSQKVMEWYGPEKGREILNALRDYAGRAQRKQAYRTEGLRRKTTKEFADYKQRQAHPEQQKPPTYQPNWWDQNVLEPGLNYLMDEQKKRNNGYWAPDTTLLGNV